MSEQLPSNIDMEKLGKKILGDTPNDTHIIPPTAHYPYFRYLCPYCKKNWEMEEKTVDGIEPCPECKLEIIMGSKEC